MWKTRVAWALYCLVILFLAALAGVVVVKLIAYPPCAPKAHGMRNEIHISELACILKRANI